MRCTICGAAHDACDRYCRNCGRRFLPPRESKGTAPAADTKQYRRTSARLKFLGCAVLAISLLIAILVQVAPDLLMSGFKPKDLGVKWTEQDYANAIERCGVVFDTAPSGTDRSKFRDEFTGIMDVEWSFTDSELTALLNGGAKPGYWPVSQAQVRIHEGNVFEISCMVNPAKLMTYPIVRGALPKEVIRYISGIPLQMPIHARAKVSITGPKQADVTMQQFSASGMSFADMAVSEQTNQILESIIHEMLKEAGPVSITGFMTGEGTMSLSGTWYRELKQIPTE